MARFTPLDRLALSETQRQVADAVRAGRRGTVPANVVAWLPRPELARRAAHLGEYVRYETSLPAPLSELAILVVARHWSCAYEWAAHAGEAAKAGVAAETIDGIGRGRSLALPPAAATVVAFARELLRDGRVSDERYEQARAVLGDAGVVDLVGVVGYYTLVAFTLNASEVPAPPGSPVLPDLA